MKYTTPAGDTVIDRQRVVGQPTTRIDGPLKVTGHAPYAYERHDVAANQAYGYIVPSAIAKGRVRSIDLAEAKAQPGVITILTTTEVDELPLGMGHTVPLFGGSEIRFYHQALALVVAETFEQARAAAKLVRVDYERTQGNHDFHALAPDAPLVEGSDGPDVSKVGDFEAAYASAPVSIDVTYETPHESHAMMEPHASIAAWEGEKLTIWTSNQMIAWSKQAVAKMLDLDPANVRLDSPFLGGGFGAKLFVRVDAVVAALAAKKAGRPVKVMLDRPLVFNNTTHRSATIQRLRFGAERDGRLTAISHECTSGNLAGQEGENGIAQTRLLYAGANRYTAQRIARLDLPEANAMRAPGETAGLMALEGAMDELAEKLGMDPVELRIVNDTQVDPETPNRPYSSRMMVECLRRGAEAFGWDKRNKTPGGMREGRWLIGHGMAVGFRNSVQMKSAARVRLSSNGKLTVETDMTDIGTGSYTILAQTAAEMLGLPLEDVTVTLGDSDMPASCGSGGQWGAQNSTSGVYAACVKLREDIAERFAMDPNTAEFADGEIRSGGESRKLTEATASGEIVAEDSVEYDELSKKYQQSTFAGHFVEIAVDAYTGETYVRRMLAACAAGRILNPISARSQVIGAMTMGVGGALTEELAVDTRFGFFVNHDLAGYEVPVHADIPHQEVIFLDELDAIASPMKAKGVGELGLCGVGAAVANALYNATGVRVREYPLTLDKYLDQLPAV
ncbi:aldehyde oxidoreductase molybdenum-binding subunit PaoC [Novosphingobium mangrovi (ex Hu et al. 2023)]|uniref:Xanthine dehydrogenase family protein molybdopterin-binding subunit n=1 Tax=Novosphingobium mangrovi (ex Hu et al. 2023) TaxID=2930094 RepID=A0ABT0ABU1_9SPHN|nr:aldehyde oxidoreductase molybdenum-binding subunit PaoC [Novosphingobium mangrovi (ex Hu et al. 2023)]MCJ1960634.1 xanthine dehydrogenase family protein molybdopterin-binding subunit [Novosphingobium mangrovi (ex Hu et al. 2023)]